MLSLFLSLHAGFPSQNDLLSLEGFVSLGYAIFDRVSRSTNRKELGGIIRDLSF